jgi:2-haloacid dehalogenase
MPQPTAAVFGVGNVLVPRDPHRLYTKLFDDQHAMDAFLDALNRHHLQERIDQGFSFDTAAAGLLREHPDQEEAIRAYVERFEEMLGDADAEAVKVLEELRAKGVPTYALANWSSELFNRTRDRYASFMNGFKGVVLSGQEKLVKPDPEIYKLLLKRYALTPETTVLVDDDKKVVDQAEQLGFIALQFDNAPQLRRDLSKLDLL